METVTKEIHAFEEGDIFDKRYRLVKRAGSGGFADVWMVEDTLRNNRVMALKIYTRLDEEGIKEMSEEYDETEDIRHPNLLTGNHFGAMGNIPYLEMKYCDGGNLLKKAGKMSPDELRRMLRDIAGGLAYLHREGLVHQDIKPENILYDTKGRRYMLADFGISGKSRSRLSKSVNKANMTLSMTESYAPPEKFSGNLEDLEPDTKSDIFSLGMTLFELVVGKLPFEPPMAAGREMLYSQGRLQLDYGKIADPQLRRIVELCTRYDKRDRLTSEEILLLLDGKELPPKEKPTVKPPTVKVKVDDGAGTRREYRPTPPTPPKPPKPAPTPNRNWLYVAVAVAAVVVAVVLVPRFLRSGGDATGPADTAMVSDFDTRYGEWTGAVAGGKPAGKGVLTYYSDDKDGRAKYEGNMHDGKRVDTDAKLTYKNGNSFRGSFVDDKLGNGRLTLKSDGLYFTGDFRNDQPYNGTWFWNDGTVYSEVVNGVEK